MDLPLQLCSLAQLRDEWKALAERMYCTTNWWVKYDDEDELDDMLLNAEQCQIHLGSVTRVAIYFKPNSFLDSVAIGFVNAMYQGTSWIPAAIKIDTNGCRMAWRDRANGISTWQIQMVKHWTGGFSTILMKSLPLIHFLLRCNLQDRLSNAINPFEVIEKMGLLGIDKNWWPVLCCEFTKPYFKAICQFIATERMRNDTVIYPRECDTFAWTRYCRPEDVKVVVVGQDPYPNPVKGIATGLAFDLPVEKTSSPSLNVVFNALIDDAPINFCKPGHGCLIGWAKQGVLLLNAALTVRDGKPGSHMKEWKRFTNAVIHHISCMNSGVVFMLWGKRLWEKEEVVDYHNFLIRSASGKNIFRHLVLKSCHPAHRRCRCSEYLVEGHVEGCMPFREGFHFSKANAFLEHHHGKGIDWNHLPAERQKEPSSSGNHFEAREV